MATEKDKAAQFRILGALNQVHGFDPSVFAEEKADLTTGSSWKKLPTPIKIAWFRLKYPEGRIAVQVTPLKEHFMARARIYFNYKDGADEYVSEATAYSEKAFWAQSSAIGFALNYAGFGSQYSVFDSNEDEEPSDSVFSDVIEDITENSTLADSKLKFEVSRGLPCIIFCHVPLTSKQMTHEQVHPDLAATEDEIKFTQAVTKYIINEPNIKAVFSGHYHSNGTEQLGNKKGYILGGLFKGIVGEIIID